MIGPSSSILASSSAADLHFSSFLGGPPKEECKVKNRKQEQRMAHAQLVAHRCLLRDTVIQIPEPNDVIVNYIEPSHVVVQRCTGKNLNIPGCLHVCKFCETRHCERRNSPAGQYLLHKWMGLLELLCQFRPLFSQTSAAAAFESTSSSGKKNWLRGEGEETFLLELILRHHRDLSLAAMVAKCSGCLTLLVNILFEFLSAPSTIKIPHVT